MSIPENWIIILRRDGGWKGSAEKTDGVRRVEVSTYDSPQETIEGCLELLEKRIKQ